MPAVVVEFTQVAPPPPGTWKWEWRSSAAQPWTAAPVPTVVQVGDHWEATFTSLPEGDVRARAHSDVTNQDSDYSNIVHVPEPGMWIGLAIGVLGFVWLARRSR